jgi:murein DD-endopeptidase MepM/ murein hydrolase activator NlpD
MRATYTILTASSRRHFWLKGRATAKVRFLAATGTLVLGVPVALAFSLYLFSGGDDDAANLPGELSPAQLAELTLPDIPEANVSAEPDDEAMASPTVAEQTGQEQQPEQVAQVEVPPEDPSHRVIRMEWGDTLAGLLLKAAVPEAEAHEAMSALRTVYNPTQIRAGEDVTVVFDDAGVFSGFEFEPEADRAVRVERQGEGYKAASVLRPLSDNVMAAEVTINGSLYESGIKAGVPVGIMADLVKSLSYSVDFQRDIHAGDTFRVMYEVKRNPEGVLVRTGDVLYAEVNLNGRIVPVYRFKDEYYDAQGKSLRRNLLRTPVNAVRISSGFGMRRHPVLGYSRMHRGMDFAAPTGTKIYASGDGVIVERGWKNGFGNYIRIRHNNTVSTAYAHMSRFERGLSRGSRVRQGQVVGYVGSTGRSTGPHLHYEVLVNGTQVNPMRVANLSTSDGLSGRELTRFRGMVQEVADQFKGIEAGRAIQVAFKAAEQPEVRAKRVND